jgi:hypothetical protein
MPTLPPTSYFVLLILFVNIVFPAIVYAVFPFED